MDPDRTFYVDGSGSWNLKTNQKNNFFRAESQNKIHFENIYFQSCYSLKLSKTTASRLQDPDLWFCMDPAIHRIHPDPDPSSWYTSLNPSIFYLHFPQTLWGKPEVWERFREFFAHNKITFYSPNLTLFLLQCEVKPLPEAGGGGGGGRKEVLKRGRWLENGGSSWGGGGGGASRATPSRQGGRAGRPNSVSLGRGVDTIRQSSPTSPSNLIFRNSTTLNFTRP